MTTKIDELVARFLSWPLPDDVRADDCATQSGYPDRTGTSLLTAAQAQKMLAHVLGDVLADAAKSERRAIVFGDIMHKHVLAMRAAVVAAHTGTPADGMRWISNTLEGPGQLPTEADAMDGSQALFDREMAEHEAFRAAHPAP